MKATKLSEFSRYFQVKPLDESTWNQYVETDPARGGNDVARLIKQLKENHSSSEYIKAVFSGHTGSGKSTELARVKQELEDDYYIDTARIGERYSLPSIDYRQVVFFCVTRLMEIAAEKNVSLTGDEIENISSWFDEKKVEETKEEGRRVGIEIGGEVGLLQALFAKFSGKLYSGGDTKEKVSKHIEERLDQLRLNMLTIVNAINKKIAPKKLLLILEDLDKLEDRDQAHKIFIGHSRQLLDIPCSIIFTFPIVLWYDTGMYSYPIRYILPMIPVSEAPAGSGLSDRDRKNKAEEGRKILTQIVYQRIDANVGLIEPEALSHMINKSGGLIRDLFYLLREAALGAEISARDTITLPDAADAVRRLRSEYANRISPSDNITINDIESTLGNTSAWPQRNPQQTEAFKRLLQTLCILEYNGDRWFNLHPLIRDYLEIKNAESKTAKTKKPAKKTEKRSKKK